METINGLIEVQTNRVDYLNDLAQDAKDHGEIENAEYWQGAKDEALDMLRKFEELKQSIDERRT